MGIETLGKSLLSSAKKKAKKGQQLGYLMGAAIGVVGAVNKGIREKAMLRAQQWDQSFTPLINSYAKEFTTINDIKTEFKDRNDTTKYVNYQESFYEPEIQRLTKIVTGGATDKTLSPAELADIRVQAIENVSDNVLKYETQVEQYKPYFDLDKKAFNDNLTALRAKGVELISDDSLKKRIGRKFFDSTEGQQLVNKIKLSDTESIDLSLPQELMAAMDTTFLNSLEGMKTRELKVSEIKIILEPYKNLEDITLLQDKILRDPPPTKLSTETKDAVTEIITAEKEVGVGSNKKVIPNVNYIGDLTFLNSANKGFTVPMSDLQALLETTYDGGTPNTDPSKQNFTDWNQFIKDVSMLTQAKEIDWASKHRNEIVSQPQREQWATDAALEIATSFTIVTKPTDPWFAKPVDVPVRFTKKTQDNDTPSSSDSSNNKSPTTTSTPEEEFKVVKVVDDSLFNKQAVVKIIDTPEWRAMPIEEQFKFFKALKNQHPNAAQEIGAMQKALLENKPLEEVMQDTLSEDMTRVDGVGEEESPPATTTSTSLLSSTVPTQEELVQEFEMLGTENMSPAEIDDRLNDMINRKADFTTDEYIKLITYLNSKQGINPTATNASLLAPVKELTDSEILANALKGSGTGRNPLEVIDDMNTRNSIQGTNLGLKTLQRETSTARQAIATSGLLRKKDFIEFLESEGTTKEEFNTTTKDYVLNIFTKYLEQLKAK
jgi:hypothetical protein